MSEETQLVVVGQQAVQTQQTGGLGFDFSSRFFKAKPATLTINQRMTQAEGAIPGKLRIVETGAQFNEMTVVLLNTPKEARQFYVGEQGSMIRSNENMMCFSNDMKRPDNKAKVPQAMYCDKCPKSDWSKWRKYKEDNKGQTDRALIPPCQPMVKILLIDTEYKLPMYMYLRSKESMDAFQKGMDELYRKFQLLASQAKKEGKPFPNLFDLSFKIKTVQGKAKTNYVLAIDGKSFQLVTEEDREAFGTLFEQLTNSGRQAQETEEAVAQDQIQAASDVIDAEVLESSSDDAINV